MPKRYSIMVVEYGSKHEVELCQVEKEPQAIVEAARGKRLRIKSEARTVFIPKYNSVRIIDHEAP